MKKFRIDSFDAINNFPLEIYARSEKIFDSVVDMKDLKDNKDNPVFTESEWGHLNEVLTECFIFCLVNDSNINTLPAIVQFDFKNLKATG